MMGLFYQAKNKLAILVPACSVPMDARARFPVLKSSAGGLATQGSLL